MGDDAPPQGALNRKRKTFDEVDIEPFDALAVGGDDLFVGDSALLLGRLVDVVGVGGVGTNSSTHALRCQVSYLRSKLDTQHVINDRLRSMIEDLFQASETRRLRKIADQNVQAKAEAESKKKLMFLNQDVKEKQKELAAANEEASFLANEVINLQNVVLAKDRQLEDLREMVLVQDRIISEHDKMNMENQTIMSELSTKSARLSNETLKMKDVLSLKEALILSKDAMIAKKDKTILDLNQSLTMKEAECILTIQNTKVAVQQCNSVRNAQRCYRCGNQRVGKYHNTSKSSTSAEFCTTPKTKRAPYWVVPAGYEVGDKRKKEPKRSIVRRRKAICTQNGIVDAGWEHWGN